MTYTNYPSFAPHTVLDWESYSEPSAQLAPKHVSLVPVLDAIMKDRGGWVRFSGGTPGIRLDKDRFVAVGHALGDLSCFHREVRPDKTIELKCSSRFVYSSS